MRGLTIPHLVDFGTDAATVGTRLDGSAGLAAWDALRFAGNSPFALAPDVAEWDAAADERPDIGARMERLAAHLRADGTRRLASYGVGGAVAKRWLMRLMPELQLTMTDAGARTVAGLHALVGDAARVEQHDLLGDGPLPADVHLFHRLDTEFTARQWRRIMRAFRGETIVLVATDVLDAARVRQELRAMRHRRGWTRAGWIRTEGAFRGLWRQTHDAEALDLGDLRAWVLHPRG